ncbi:MAG TPA: hypothetical protein VFJ85_04360 [Acidimicrobiales bacterium]|nr:hypothetical protein [Acidimicrobiales bacterium]
MRIRRATFSGVLVMGAVLVATFGSSWACSGVAMLDPLTPAAAARGSEVVVSGRAWSTVPAASPSTEGSTTAATVGTVEIRWGGTTGPLLATVSPVPDTWSQKITVPAAEPGFYPVVAVGRAADGTVLARTTETLEVLGSADASTAAAPGSSGADPAPATAPILGTAAPAAAVAAPPSDPAATKVAAGGVADPARPARLPAAGGRPIHLAPPSRALAEGGVHPGAPLPPMPAAGATGPAISSVAPLPDILVPPALAQPAPVVRPSLAVSSSGRAGSSFPGAAALTIGLPLAAAGGLVLAARRRRATAGRPH